MTVGMEKKEARTRDLQLGKYSLKLWEEGVVSSVAYSHDSHD